MQLEGNCHIDRTTTHLTESEQLLKKPCSPLKNARRLRARQRWFLALTLARNPTLLQVRFENL